MKIQLIREMDADEFWSTIWGSNPEVFGYHWVDIDFITGDWETAGTVKVSMINPHNEDETVVRIIGINGLVKAYNELWEEGELHPSCLDLGDMDCVGADAIVQKAVYGKVVFG